MPTPPAKIDFRKVRDFGDTLNVSFLFIRQHFKPLMLAMLFIAGPFVLVGSVIPMLMLTRLSAPTDGMDNWMVGLGASTLVNMLSSIMGAVMGIGVIYEYILLYYQRDTASPNIQTADVWQAIRKDFWRLLGSVMGLSLLFILAILVMSGIVGMLGVAMGGGTAVFLFFVAMVAFTYLAVPVSLVIIINLHENIGFFDALPRAFYLVKGFWWQTFGLIVMCVLIQYSIMLLCMVPFMIVGFSAEMFTEMGSSMETTVTYAIGFSIALTLVIALSYCLFLTVSAFQYFSLVERKESVGLLEKIDTMGEEETPAKAEDFYADEEEHY